MQKGPKGDSQHLRSSEWENESQDTVEPYYDLGNFHRSISSNNQAAQTWFDRGIIWAYGFNHAEAVKCFKRAIEFDSQCAMAYWGLAFSLGPHLNKPWETFGADERISVLREAHDAIDQAIGLANQRSTSNELGLIRAMKFRYRKPEAGLIDLAAWSHQYVAAMRDLYLEHPDDLDIITSFADAMLNLWLYGGRNLLREIEDLFELAFTLPNASNHPGLLHLYIHLVELSETPERGTTAAEHLRDLVPDAGHLQHMPTHIDLLVGDYRRAIAYNLEAIRADEKYLVRDTSHSFYSNYRIHNYHALIYSATLAGNSRIATEYLPRLEASLPESLLRKETMVDRLEVFVSVRLHVLIRFGRWKDILDIEFPKDKQLYCVTTSMTHYARGIAWAATGNVHEALREQDHFRNSLSEVAPTRMAFPNNCNQIFKIAEEMLEGELQYRSGQLDTAFEHLRKAVVLDDALKHNEPWGWMVPTRHALAALLLESGQIEEALAVYAEDLGLVDTVPRGQRHPKNVWALHGIHECLLKLGRTVEANDIAPVLKSATQSADIAISASCFCRGAAVSDARL